MQTFFFFSFLSSHPRIFRVRPSSDYGGWVAAADAGFTFTIPVKQKTI